MAVNVPVTIWRKTNGMNDSIATGALYIVDTLDAYLVDPQGSYVVDTGLRMDVTPVTVWTEDDSV